MLLSMLLVLIITVFSTISSGQTTEHNTALRFGQTAADHIQLPDWNVSYWNSINRLSVCTWIKKLFSKSSRPVVLQINNIVTLGDDGYNWVAGTTLNLTSNYTRGIGTWFHVCLTWTGQDGRTRAYLDGHLIGTTVTKERTLSGLGGKILIGLGNREVYKTEIKLNDTVFGGDLFKLNIYNRVLTETEIKIMSSSMCSNEEEKLASIKVLSWQKIISPETRRSGDVFEIPIRCQENARQTQELEKNLVEVLGRLQKTEQVQGKYLIVMITLGLISSISLILLIFPNLKQLWNSRPFQAMLLRGRIENSHEEAPQDLTMERNTDAAGSDHFAQDVGSRDSIYDNFELYRIDGSRDQENMPGREEGATEMIYVNETAILSHEFIKNNELGPVSDEVVETTGNYAEMVINVDNDQGPDEDDILGNYAEMTINGSNALKPDEAADTSGNYTEMVINV